MTYYVLYWSIICTSSTAINFLHLEHYHWVKWRQSSFQVFFLINLASGGRSLESGHFIVQDYFDFNQMSTENHCNCYIAFELWQELSMLSWIARGPEQQGHFSFFSLRKLAASPSATVRQDHCFCMTVLHWGCKLTTQHILKPPHAFEGNSHNSTQLRQLWHFTQFKATFPTCWIVINNYVHRNTSFLDW